MIHGLINREEEANEAFLSGRLDRDSWAKEIETINDMLRVVGVSLLAKPWEGYSAQTPAKGPGF
jgi:hypothetical protein